MSEANQHYKINDRLLWTLIRDTPIYVLNHPKGRLIIVEISENFLIGKKFNRSEYYFPIYEAIPKNNIMSMEAFKCFQEDKEDADSMINNMFDKILARKN